MPLEMPKALLVIDTNIISHALTANQTPAYVKLFQELEIKYQFVVTGYTKFELLRSSDKEHRKKILEYIQNEMTSVELSKQLVEFAARVNYLYRKHPDVSGSKITEGDVFNAAYAIAKQCHILTIDNTDYPRKFFGEVERKRIRYTSKKNKETTDVGYILSPDIEQLKQCFEDHNV